jgi:methyl-accepting chemotaxis protein
VAKDIGDKVADVGVNVEEVGEKVEDIGEKVEDIGEKVEDIGEKVEDIDDKVRSVDEKVQVVIHGTRRLPSQLSNDSNIYAPRQQASKSSGTRNKIGYSTGGQRHRRNQVFVAS